MRSTWLSRTARQIVSAISASGSGAGWTSNRTFSAVARASSRARSGIAATIFCSALRASRVKSTWSLRLNATATAAASRGVKLSGGNVIERSTVYPPVRPCFVASGTPACPSALRSRSMVLTLTSKCPAN